MDLDPNKSLEEDYRTWLAQRKEDAKFFAELWANAAKDEFPTPEKPFRFLGLTESEVPALYIPDIEGKDNNLIQHGSGRKTSRAAVIRGTREVLKMTNKQKEAMQKPYINNVFMALANHDDNAFWSAVDGLADLRKERPDEVLFKLYKGLKLIEAQKRQIIVKGGDIVLNDKLKVGDTVTDGYQTYVVDRDHELHYVGSGNHAKYHVSQKELKDELSK